MINNQDLCPFCCIEFELESERLLLALTGSQGKGIFFRRQRHITHGFASRVRKEQPECTEEFWAGQCWASELSRQGMQFTQSVSQSLGTQCKSNLRVRIFESPSRGDGDVASAEKLKKDCAKRVLMDCRVAKYFGTSFTLLIHETPVPDCSFLVAQLAEPICGSTGFKFTI